MKRMFTQPLRTWCFTAIAMILAAGMAIWPSQQAHATECTITNMQGTLAAGSVTFFNTQGRAIYTLFNPTGSNAFGDPGCFVSNAYPFTINNVQLNIGDATLFGLANPGGVLEYKVQIIHAANPGDTCTILDSLMFETSTLTLTVTTGVGFNPVTVPVNIDVDGPFFVAVEAVSWSGQVDRTPSIVLWTNQGIPTCRQYVKTFDAGGDPVITDYALYWTAPGWTNVVVNGELPPPTGTVDVSVTNLSAGPDFYFGIPTDVSATINNIGTADLGNIVVNLLENGNVVATTIVPLLAGTSQNHNFTYTPSVQGNVTLAVEAVVAGDINTANNIASMEIVVQPPPSACIFEDDIESYTLGGLVAQSAQWVTWTPGAANQDAEVSNDYALSGTQSVKIGAAPQDVNFLLGNQTAGTWKVSFHLYIPGTNGGYWNIQKSQTSGVAWAMQMFLQPNGSGSVDAGGANAATFTYPKDQWIHIEMVINLDNDVANLYLDDVLLLQWPYRWSATSQATGTLQLGSINFYPAAVSSPLMYIDDVSLCFFYNNGPCEAFELLLGEVVEGDNTDATPFDPTMAADATCWIEPVNTIHNDVWYKFVVPENGDYMVTTNLEELTNDDTQLLIYASDDGTCTGNFTVVGCDDDVSSSNYLSTAYISDLTAGTVLYILVDGWMGTSGTFQIGVFMESIEGPDNNECITAANLSSLLGQATNVEQLSGVFHNANASGHAPTPPCFEDEMASASTWYSFMGDGNSYFITTVNCTGVSEYADDTQIAIYTGSCSALTMVACNEDIDFQGGIWEAGLSFQTEAGVSYFMLIDTYFGDAGEFCVSVTNETEVSTTRAMLNTLMLYPNPVMDYLLVESASPASQVNIYNAIGQLVMSMPLGNQTTVQIETALLPSGIYTIQMITEFGIATGKFTRIQ